MQENNRKWLQYACYAGALGTSLVLQRTHPEMFALLCTPLPIGGGINNSNPAERLELPLNSPILGTREVENEY